MACLVAAYVVMGFALMACVAMNFVIMACIFIGTGATRASAVYDRRYPKLLNPAVYAGIRAPQRPPFKCEPKVR